jgi:hypothetical protein
MSQSNSHPGNGCLHKVSSIFGVLTLCNISKKQYLTSNYRESAMIKVMSNKKRRSIDTKEKHFRKILMKEIFKERKNEQRNALSIYQGG